MSHTPVIATLDFIARHPLSSKRFLRAVMRYARWQIVSRVVNEVEFSWIEKSKLIVRRGMTGATGNIYCGLHEFVEMAFLLHLLQPNDLFVDVGANIGSYTVLASSTCGARTISVEPDPGSAHWLRRNVEVNGIDGLVTVIEAALSRQPGYARFTVGLDTTNRLANDDDTDAQVVRVTTLDECLHQMNPALIKLDVEGSEAQVLAGGRDCLRNPSLLAVQIETVDESVQEFLEGLGFRRAAYNPFTRRLSEGAPEIPSPNTLFVRNFVGCRERIDVARSRKIMGSTI